MLLDSNIIIYAAQPQNDDLRTFIAQHSPFVSALSYLEVVGYHRLKEDDRQYFELFFQIAPLLPISDMALHKAVEIRQQRKVSLGDAIIAGTALAHKLKLVTRNTTDFKWIQELELINPFEAEDSESK